MNDREWGWGKLPVRRASEVDLEVRNDVLWCGTTAH